MAFHLLRTNSRQLSLGRSTVDLVITSPPYMGLRAYEDGGEQYDGQIGDEPTLEEYLDALWQVTAEAWDALKPGGNLFFNIGDRYDKKGQATANGAGRGVVRTKSLIGLPWRYVLGCIDDNAVAGGQWILRGEIIWHRTNALPESCNDRVMRRHEQAFHLTKTERAFSDAHALRPVNGDGTVGSIPGSIWDIPSESIRGLPEGYSNHTATFPTELVRRIVLGWSPAGICGVCDKPWTVRIDREFTGEHNAAEAARQKARSGARAGGATTTLGRTKHIRRRVAGYECACGLVGVDAPSRPAVVADVFGGSGTTALVADALGRHGISIDLSGDYHRLAQWRRDSTRAQSQILARSHELVTGPDLMPVTMAFPPS